MSEIQRVLFFLVFGVVFVDCAVMRGKAFFCRDPDTGKLYAVNTTWASSTFCGNYTCRLRRRNLTAEKSPIRQLNVTNIDNHNSGNVTVTIKTKLEPNVLPILHKITADPKNMIAENVTKPQHKNVDKAPTASIEATKKYAPKSHDCKNTDSKDSKSYEESDRFLTEKEIDNIADLLHSVKKSDLDAVVDIYNLAQDIYKEMEKATDKEIVNEALHLLKEEENHRKNSKRPAAYWANDVSVKEKSRDKHDMTHQSSRLVHSTAKTKSDTSFFNGALTSSDFGKIPYYYPISYFQRSSSFTNYPTKTTTLPPATVRPLKVTKKVLPSNRNKNNNGRHSNGKHQKLIQPSLLLPYPFANIHQYKYNDSNHLYYPKNRWILDYYNKHRYYEPHRNGYIAPLHKAILVNPYLSNEVQAIEQNPNPVKVVISKKPLADVKEKNKIQPSWKTKPISIEILKDIRADIDSSKLVKAFPLRKRVKLERAGKLINLDDLNSQNLRRRRSVDDGKVDENKFDENEEYETYLEKVTCKEQVEPGFFRVGNMSQPFPNCCPQMINTR